MLRRRCAATLRAAGVNRQVASITHGQKVIYISYFFRRSPSGERQGGDWREQLQWPETIELIQLYYAVGFESLVI